MAGTTKAAPGVVYRRRPVPSPVADNPRHILILTDRDWTHPEAGGTGTVLYGIVSRWLAWGHRVTVIAGDYPGAEKVSHLGGNLTVHRMGTRLTVFPRAAWATLRGVGRDADVVLEVCNGIAFFTSFWRWLRQPRVLTVFHVHQEHYVTELGLRGRIAALLLEHVPLRFLYPGVPVLTISASSRDELVALGIERERVHVVYMGLDAAHFGPGAKAPEPTLVYLGRLKAYKRIEHVLDVAEAIPAAHLDIAGDGDHRPALEAEVARRGLDGRVTFHGHVGEERKAELLQRAWVALTASSAEGWCLTVIEAGACRTPTAALRIGGLAEAIVDGQTGLLADTPEQLTREVRALVDEPERLEELSDAALARARLFTWDTTAEGTLEVMDHARVDERRRLRDTFARSDAGKAAGLAAATLANNAIQLVFTVVFTRLLGATDYGSLAALISAFLILLVAGQSMQVAAAREAALDRLGHPELLRATLRGWTNRLLVALVAVAAASALLREPLAHVIGVAEHPWAAAAIPPTGVLWMLLSLQRGALQGLREYGVVGISIVGEAFGRLVFGLILVLGGLGVTGALLGTPLAFAAAIIGLELALKQRVGPVAEQEEARRSLRGLIGDGWVPIVGLFLLATLQNVDVIVAKHKLTGDAAGSYAAAAVAAKAVVWVAIGLGLHLLPEATRRAAAGLDPRPVLLRALGVLAVVAVPALIIFALFSEPLLRIAFGPDLTLAADALPLLGLAMTLLAVAYLTVQYMLALGETRFLWVLGVVALTEPVLLSRNDLGIVAFATVVFGIQCVAAAAVLALGLRARSRRRAVRTT
jgi:glycosyltransferase involved in cell wall biosynthesis/O-antigen/teichoic acid export membrane protein